jgi:hypothetical protein
MKLEKQNVQAVQKLSVLVGSLLTLFLMVTLSCRLPFDLSAFLPGEGSLEENLSTEGLLAVEEVQVEDGTVTIEYQEVAGGDMETMVAGWIYALESAVEAEAEAEEIILRTIWEGEPYLEITTTGEDVRSLTAGDLSPEEFLADLDVEDLRSEASRLSQILMEEGLDLISVEVQGQQVVIEYYPEEAGGKADLMEEWLVILDQVRKMELDVEVVRIRSAMLDTSIFVVEVPMSKLEDYYAGDLTVFQFLLGLTLEEEPVNLDQ